MINSCRIVLSIFFIVALAATTSLLLKKRHNLETPGSSILLLLERTQAAQGKISGSAGKDYGPGEVLVKFKPYVTEGEIDKIAKISGMEMMRILSPPNLFLFKIIGNSSLGEVIRSLEKFEEIEYSEPNYLRKMLNKKIPHPSIQRQQRLAYRSCGPNGDIFFLCGYGTIKNGASE